MKLFGFTKSELIALWPYGLEFYRSLVRLIKARKKKGYSQFQTVRDVLGNAIQWNWARAEDAPHGPSEAEQRWMDRASGPMGGVG